MPAGAEERAALATRACTHLRSSVERQAYSHDVKAGTCVSSRVRRSRIITCLKGRHALHYRLVIDQHADRSALAACARRHVGDTTISNRVRPAAHHDAIVHLVPRYWPEAMMEALVADERRFVRLLIGAPRLGVLPTNSLSSGGEIIGVCGENRPFLPQNSRYSPRTQRYSRLLHYVTAFCRGLAIV